MTEKQADNAVISINGKERGGCADGARIEIKREPCPECEADEKTMAMQLQGVFDPSEAVLIMIAVAGTLKNLLPAANKADALSDAKSKFMARNEADRCGNILGKLFLVYRDSPQGQELVLKTIQQALGMRLEFNEKKCTHKKEEPCE